MPSFVNPLVLYGDDSPETQGHITWLANRFSRLGSHPLPIDPEQEYLCFFHESLQNLKEIWIVKGEAFSPCFAHIF